MAGYRDLPGPRTLPFFGVGIPLQKHGCDYLCQLTQRYGRLVKFALPRIKGVLVSDKELIKTVLLQSERQFYKGPLYKTLQSVVGLGLVTNQGPSWRQRRKHLNPLFQHEKLSDAQLDPILDRATGHLCSKIEDSIRQAKPLDTTKALMELTFSVLIDAFFSGDLSPENHQYEKLAEAFSVIQWWISMRFVSVFKLPFSYPTPANLTLRQSLKTLKGAIEYLYEIRKSRSSPTSAARTGAYPDLLDRLLSMRDAHTGQALSSADIFDEILTFLIAGHDTTALTLSYTLTLFAENQSYLDELTHGLRSDQETLVEKALTSLEHGILESMRIYPAVYMINRTSRDVFSFGGYDFAPHTTFFVSQIATHRDPEYSPDPMSFKPRRFAEGVPDDFSFYPFAGGPRTCIGSHLAMIEAKGVLKRVLRRFKPIKLDKKFKITPSLTSIPSPSISLWWERIG